MATIHVDIVSAEGEIYSVGLADEGAQGAWLEALAGSARPQPIARATHILLKHQGSRRLASWRDPTGREIQSRSKAAAIKMLKEYKRLIEDGAEDLAELAKQVSDCDTAKHGGDLGWFSPDQMVKPFSDAVVGLENGAFSNAPVQTQFGWHVIKVEDRRTPEPPAFEEVREQLEAELTREVVTAHIDELRAAAELTKFGFDGDPADEGESESSN